VSVERQAARVGHTRNECYQVLRSTRPTVSADCRKLNKIRFEWRESSSPFVTPPTHRRLRSRLLDRSTNKKGSFFPKRRVNPARRTAPSRAARGRLFAVERRTPIDAVGPGRPNGGRWRKVACSGEFADQPVCVSAGREDKSHPPASDDDQLSTRSAVHCNAIPRSAHIFIDLLTCTNDAGARGYGLDVRITFQNQENLARRTE